MLTQAKEMLKASHHEKNEEEEEEDVQVNACHLCCITRNVYYFKCRSI